MTKYPWLKFYPTDWHADPQLRRCSLSARGLWIELIGVMHRSAEYGHLDPSLTERDIGHLVGSPLKTVRRALTELEKNRVFDRGEKGEIVSRRMVRDHAKALKDQRNGGRGGNPNLTPGVNPGDKAQIPEARIQTPETSEIRDHNHAAPHRHQHDDDADADETLTRKLLSVGSAPSISDTAVKLTNRITTLCGHRGAFIPKTWAGAPKRVQSWLNRGWTAEQIEVSCIQQIAQKRGGPPHSIAYFERGIGEFVARLNAPLPGACSTHASGIGRPLSLREQRLAERDAFLEDRRLARNGDATGNTDGAHQPCRTPG